MSELTDRAKLLDRLSALARRAGALVMEVYATPFTVEDKGGNDPVTLADKRANALICEALTGMFPGVPIVAEESPPSSYANWASASAAFFVDPLDGTREFVSRNGEFAVMIGLAERGRAVAGVVFAPALDLLWRGAEGVGAQEEGAHGELQALLLDAQTSPARISDARFVVSRSRRAERLDQLMREQPPREVVQLGGAGLKAMAIARGQADAYVQLGGAGCLWDSCAPEAIVRAAGGVLSDEQGQPIDYAASTVRLTRGLVAAPPRLHPALIAAIASLIQRSEVARPAERRGRAPCARLQFMRDKADVVIVGAGIMGLSIAYNLARRQGVTRVTVVDRSYLCGGASGRNGGGVRAQWSSEANVRLMQESIRICEDFAREMKINVWFRQGGYLFLARDEEKRRALERSVQVQNDAGLGTRMLTPHEARKVVPELDVSGVVAASYNPTDGVVFPWPFVWGYAEGAKKLGVEIVTHTEVQGFRTRGKKLTAIQTSRGEIATETVVNAAGAWSPEIARLLDVQLPNRPHRHEICSTEPLKPWLSPLVADLSSGLYFSQSTRGEIVGGVSNEQVPPGIDMRSSHAFLRLYAKALLGACPRLGSVKVLRQWAGCYDLTPDANPIVGEVDEVERFFQVSGFMGHGFMMAPVIGRLMAQHIAEGTQLPMFERWSLRRFREGKLLSEAMIIG